jgi:hypothetical protein
MGRARQARQKAYVRNQRLNAPQETHQLELGGCGLGRSAYPVAVVATWRTPRLVDVADREATVKSAA